MKIITLSEAFNKLGFSRSTTSARIDGGCFSRKKMEIDPKDFLAQAEFDFSSDLMGYELNCITNAKRAIVCQMDQILLTFGYKSNRWNIPKKVSKIKDLGLIVPRILSKVSNIRNLLEHEYQKPNNIEIEEALDIATLFVSLSQSIITPFQDGMTFFDPSDPYCEKNNRDLRSICFSLEKKENKIQYHAFVRNEELTEKNLGIIIVPSGTKLFEELVGLARLLVFKMRNISSDRMARIFEIAFG